MSLGASRVFFVFNTFRVSVLDHAGTQCLISHNRRPLTKPRLRRPLVVWNCIIFHVARRPPKQRSPLLSTGAVNMPYSTRPSTPPTTGSIQKCILIAGPLINIVVALYQIYVTRRYYVATDGILSHEESANLQALFAGMSPRRWGLSYC